MGNRYSKAQTLEAISNSGGIMSTVQKRLGCKSWETARKYVEKWADTREAWNNENQHTDDLAQSVVIKDIQGGNVQTAKWWLERRRRKAFCLEKYIQQELDFNEQEDTELKIEIVDGTNDD
ncbi:MAG: hypothetical protein NC489_18325 [Ruminococcus flavefaciens]|nr:hypothetical protein [Ruminococcus flavefaciens]